MEKGPQKAVGKLPGMDVRSLSYVGKVPCAHAQSCPTLCGPTDCSLPGSSVHEIFQARRLQRVAISSSANSSATPWTVAFQAPLSMGFPRQEYWSGLPFPSAEIFPAQGLNPCLLHCRKSALQTDSLSLSHQGNPIYRVQHAKHQAG